MKSTDCFTLHQWHV